MLTRLRHWTLGLRALLALALAGSARRGLWAEMRRYSRALPAALAGPLPQAVAAQTPTAPDLALPPAAVRELADAAALFERGTPLGLCLRRSMLRYHFLRRAGVPLVLNFGARFMGGQADREITGHAWVTLDGQPYHEDGENYQGFTVMLRFPADTPPRE
jgi:hypothetical protein